MTNISIFKVGGVVNSQHGEVIAIMHQYAYHGKGKTIHSSLQLDAHKNDLMTALLKFLVVNKVSPPQMAMYIHLI